MYRDVCILVCILKLCDAGYYVMLNSYWLHWLHFTNTEKLNRRTEVLNIIK